MSQKKNYQNHCHEAMTHSNTKHNTWKAEVLRAHAHQVRRRRELIGLCMVSTIPLQLAVLPLPLVPVAQIP